MKQEIRKSQGFKYSNIQGRRYHLPSGDSWSLESFAIPLIDQELLEIGRYHPQSWCRSRVQASGGSLNATI